MASRPLLLFCSGGLEMLFDNQRRHAVDLPATDPGGKPATIALLIDHLCQHLMKDPRTDMFVLDNHMYVEFLSLSCLVLSCPYCLVSSCLVLSRLTRITAPLRLSKLNHPLLTGRDSRPGILVLINDADWELEGEEAYEIQPRDNILFVSTLHGG